MGTLANAVIVNLPAGRRGRDGSTVRVDFLRSRSVTSLPTPVCVAAVRRRDITRLSRDLGMLDWGGPATAAQRKAQSVTGFSSMRSQKTMRVTRPELRGGLRARCTTWGRHVHCLD